MSNATPNTGSAATAQAGTCPVRMHDRRPCGRCLLGQVAVNGVSYCLMHYAGAADEAAFQKEFERILDEAGEGIADFTGFVFPDANYAGREFNAGCVFSFATFAQLADFGSATFTRRADFGSATFRQGADFRTAAFMGEADFRNAAFTGGAHFGDATFAQDASFIMATFTRDAYFGAATFAQRAHFGAATFAQGADFRSAMFAQDAYFGAAAFAQDAHFGSAAFAEDATFFQTTFAGNADFTGTTFTNSVYFGGARFLAAAWFRETKFRTDREELPGPVFSLAEFSRPEAAVFYKTYLGQALFHNCDVSKLNFSSAEWREREKSGKRMVFEEVVSLDNEAARALRTWERSSGDRDYGLIAELYQQLKKNYDERKDYWTAGDFHYGEMEMKRLHSQRKSGGTRWVSRNLGLVAWYKYASQYGESYVRPAIVLSIVLVIFTLFFPLAGLERNEGAPHSAAAADRPAPATLARLSYGHFHDFVGAYSRRGVGTAAFFGNSLMTVLSVAGFQKELKYEPSYPWGRALALLELLLTSTLIALFLLAVRRQFKR